MSGGQRRLAVAEGTSSAAQLEEDRGCLRATCGTMWLSEARNGARQGGFLRGFGVATASRNHSRCRVALNPICVCQAHPGCCHPFVVYSLIVKAQYYLLPLCLVKAGGTQVARVQGLHPVLLLLRSPAHNHFVKGTGCTSCSSVCVGFSSLPAQGVIHMGQSHPL